MSSLFSLEGKTAMVTGASKGIGEGVALTLAEHGANVALAARSAGLLEGVARRAEAFGRTTLVVPTDVTRTDAIAALVSRTVETFGRIDILVNNAGAGDFENYAWAMNLSEQQWDNMFALNLRSAMFVSQAVARVMREQGGGRIINIASRAGTGPAPRQANYGAAKAGMINLTQTLAQEWAQFGIRVNSIIPGIILTDNARDGMFPTPEREERLLKAMPLGRFGMPRDIGAAVVYFASEAGEWVTGSSVVIDGGLVAARVFG
jgi:NAD(P)-dependent dehydrogenase (short-subunit alcohol dehydrogenase family)